MPIPSVVPIWLPARVFPEPLLAQDASYLAASAKIANFSLVSTDRFALGIHRNYSPHLSDGYKKRFAVVNRCPLEMITAMELFITAAQWPTAYCPREPCPLAASK
jgi:hypothetical protein